MRPGVQPCSPMTTAPPVPFGAPASPVVPPTPPLLVPPRGPPPLEPPRPALPELPPCISSHCDSAESHAEKAAKLAARAARAATSSKRSIEPSVASSWNRFHEDLPAHHRFLQQRNPVE